MQKLTGLDEMFLSVDAAGTTNGVMGGLVIYKRPRSPHAAREEAMVERIQTRFGQLPFMGWKLARTPLGLDHHRWVDAGPVDVADHVRTIQLPGKGTDRDLAAEVAALMEVPLPKDRPLWELVIIEGLAKGRIAHLLRIHHGLIDGSSVPTVLDILSDSPTPGLALETPRSWHSGRLNGRIGLTGRGLVATVARPVKFAGLQVRTVRFLASRAEEDGRLRAVPAFAGRIVPGKLGAPFRGLANRGRSDELPRVHERDPHVEEAGHAVQRPRGQRTQLRLLRPPPGRLQGCGQGVRSHAQRCRDRRRRRQPAALPRRARRRPGAAAGGVHPGLVAYR